MRNLWMALILTGCVLEERQTTFYEPTPDLPAALGRFAPLAEADNPGHGVVPDVEGISAWMGMGDRICEVRGTSGAIATDIFVDGDVAPGLVLLDGSPAGWLAADGNTVLVTDGWGEVQAEYDVPGEVIGGVLAEDGMYILIATDAGCAVLWIHADGTQELYEVEDEVCDTDTDIEVTADGVLLGGGTGIISVTPVGVVPVADGSQVSADPTTQAWYSGTPGERNFTAHLPDGGTQAIALPGPLVDFSARAGELVALTSDHELVQYDTITHNPVAIEGYTGPLGMTRLQLTDDASGIVLHNWMRVQFYALRNDRAPAGSLPVGGGFDSDPASSQGN